MDLLVYAQGVALWGQRRLRCALGKSGVCERKVEGDGATPAGSWPMRHLLYRADRLVLPATRLEARPLAPADGWCADPADLFYNRRVTLPYPASTEQLWREDALYDLVVPLGYNDDPVLPGAGSAIFLHLARAGYVPTEGCIALARADLLLVLAAADPSSRVIVAPSGATPR
jgi:L,D-peptidoglycan transpeptidase YkuD (ErfK/YbiS/YcfS/YnhG family)